MTVRRIYPWFDRSGRISTLKLVVFLAIFAPCAWTLLSYELGTLGPRPLIEAIHQTGLWAIRFLVISLAITPLRRALQWPRLVLVRRMVGVATFGYATLHLALYIIDQAFDWRLVASEIVTRFYLTIGVLALMSLSVLAATSTDVMIRRLSGRRWRRVHQSVYVIAVLALVHYFIQSKLNVAEPTVIAGLLFGSWPIGRLSGSGARIAPLPGRLSASVSLRGCSLQSGKRPTTVLLTASIRGAS